jgi:hypothetical protein
LVIDNCAPYDIVFATNEILGVLEFKPEECIPLTEQTISAIILTFTKSFQGSKEKIFEVTNQKKANLQVPIEYKQQYLGILFKHQEAISID